MSRIIIKCDGVSLGKLLIPPFILKVGEYISLNFPIDHAIDFQEEKKIISVFTARIFFSGINIYEPLVELREPPYQKLFLKGPLHVFYNETAKSFLMKHTSYSKEEVLSITNRLNIKPTDKITSLGGNIRKLLALEVVYMQSSHLLLNTLGIDPLGVEALFKRIEERLPTGSVLELNYLTSRGYTNFPGAKVIQLRYK